MRPFRLFKSPKPLKRRVKYINKLKAPKVPLRYFKNVHTPQKPEIVFPENQDVCS